jgi:hypothetical protein
MANEQNKDFNEMLQCSKDMPKLKLLQMKRASGSTAEAECSSRRPRLTTK